MRMFKIVRDTFRESELSVSLTDKRFNEGGAPAARRPWVTPTVIKSKFSNVEKVTPAPETIM